MTDKPLRLMTKAQFARDEYKKISGRACSRKYLSKPEMVELLAPAMHADATAPGKFLIDADAALALLKNNADPARQFVGDAELEDDDDQDGDGLAPRRDHELFETKKKSAAVGLQLKEIELEERLGNTLSKAEVRAAFLAAGDVLRQQLAQRNERIAAALAAMTDERAIKIFLDQEDRTVLEAIKNDLNRRRIPTDPEIPGAAAAA